jgi:hypothetical protein
MVETVIVSRELLQQALNWIHYHRRAYAIDEPIEERILRATLAQAGHTELDLTDAYNRRLRRQLEQEWCDVQSIKAALERKEQEPVAWMDDFGNAFPLGAIKGAGSWRDDHQRNWTPLYTHPPRREWQGLTMQEVKDLAGEDDIFGAIIEFARAIERALKEKNHG